MDDSQIEQALTEAQEAMKAADLARVRRQDAVVAAREAGWSKYRIAQVLDVGGPTVDSILKAAERDKTRPT